VTPRPHLSLRGVSRHFTVSGRRTVRAVENVDLDIARGETFGLVGESGCGKSTLGRTIKGIYRPSAGTILFDG
jgi:oligopeptide transport system ATP-binding protein